jgi:hypothetical protein
MATTTPNFGFDIPQSTDLVKDGATAIAALGTDIDTAFVDLKGGTTGQVLAKASGTDLDFSWVEQDDSDAIQNAQLTAKGALISAFSAGSPATLTVGTNNQVLTADSTTATGLKWAAVSSKILQVVSVQKVDTFSSTAASPTAITGLSASITPTSASSQVYVILTLGRVDSSAANNVAFRLKRDSTVVGGGTAVSNRLSSWISIGPGGANQGAPMAASYLDSPATTSSVTYSIEGWNDTTSRTFFVNRSNNDPDNTEAGASRPSSTITLIEVGA